MNITIYGTSRSGHSHIIENFLSWDPGVVIINYENPKNLDRAQTKNFICMRDYLNCIASLSNIKINHTPISIQSWHFLATEGFINKRIPVIQYEKFISSAIYRKIFCKMVGGEYNENEMDKMPRRGMMSS